MGANSAPTESVAPSRLCRSSSGRPDHTWGRAPLVGGVAESVSVTIWTVSPGPSGAFAGFNEASGITTPPGASNCHA